MELKDRAERLFGAGKFRRSLQLYRELIAREPRDPRLRVRCGELRRRLEAREEAAHEYLAAAKLFAAQGYGGRARAALKIAEELAPFDEEVVKANLTAVPVPAPVRPQSNVLGALRPRRIELGVDTDFCAVRPELPGIRKALPGRDPTGESTDPNTRWVQLQEGDPQEAPADLCSEEDFERMHGLAP
ncbi:MAG: hypothetical protein M3Y59_03080 [Myxococcota bacterium]|nr:hypothetical protein [Myxococcota bacterium]